MQISGDQKHVFCHICQEWKRIAIDTYILSEEEQSNFEHDQIRCLKCKEDNGLGALLGYRKDVSFLMQYSL